MTAHKHAHLMMQYAQDALETDKPWERWQISASSNKWGPLRSHPCWNEAYEYRRKPRTITYTVTIPEPLREAPEPLGMYWLAQPTGECCVFMYWHGHDCELRWLKRGLCFATEADAIAAAKAMLPVKGEEA